MSDEKVEHRWVCLEFDEDEERWHRRPEPVEEPPFCGECLQYGHDSLDCTWDDYNDDED